MLLPGHASGLLVVLLTAVASRARYKDDVPGLLGLQNGTRCGPSCIWGMSSGIIPLTPSRARTCIFRPEDPRPREATTPDSASMAISFSRARRFFSTGRDCGAQPARLHLSFTPTSEVANMSVGDVATIQGGVGRSFTENSAGRFRRFSRSVWINS